MFSWGSPFISAGGGARCGLVNRVPARAGPWRPRRLLGRPAREEEGGREGGGRCDSREDLKISSARGLLAVWCGGRTGLNMDDCTRSRYLERAATRSPWRWLEQPTGASGRDTSGPNHYTLVFNVNSLQPVGFYSFHGVNKPWHRLDSGKLISLCGK